MVVRHVLHPFAFPGALLTAIASLAATAWAETSVPADVHVQHDGVTLDAYTGNGRIAFCFNADKNVRIASEYGVEFKVPRSQAKLWKEPLPKLVAGKEPYFDLPLRIELKTRGASRPRQVSMGLGVCVSAIYCTPVSFEITIPATNGAGGEFPACAN